MLTGSLIGQETPHQGNETSGKIIDCRKSLCENTTTSQLMEPPK